MDSGRLIEDLFDLVERTEQAATPEAVEIPEPSATQPPRTLLNTEAKALASPSVPARGRKAGEAAWFERD